ncbi:hypothetical protein AGMMS49957_09420 [Synergistales bacterium]|nr:hypothetical protein AGMMS49957_09420 [Synergistales bacterium]
MTNFSLKWLAAKLDAGEAPRAEDGAARGAEGLRVFVSSTEEGGQVEIFDMGYEPLTASPSENELSLFPPHCPDGYLIRAQMAGKGQAALITESVFVMKSGDTPLGGRFYKLESRPVYSREIFR